jgi:hypothetical protein
MSLEDVCACTCGSAWMDLNVVVVFGLVVFCRYTTC